MFNPSLRSLFSLWQPESEAEVAAGGEGTSGAAVKRGLSLEGVTAGQDVKRFRTAAGAPSTVSSISRLSDKPVKCASGWYKPSPVLSLSRSLLIQHLDKLHFN